MRIEDISIELEKLKKIKDFNSIKSFCTKHLQQHKQHQGLLEALASAHYGLNEYESAITTYLTLIQVKPNSIVANLYLARIYTIIKNFKKADFYYLETRKLDQNFLLEMEYASFLAKHNMLNKALKIYNNCLKIEPDNFLIYYEIGNIFLKDRKFITAINYFKQSIQKNDRYFKCYNNLAIAYNNLGKTMLAIDSLKKSIAIEPNQSLTYSNLGLVYQAEGKLKEAIDNFNIAIDLNPSDGETHRYLSISKKYLKNDPHINQMSQLLSRTSNLNNKISLNFALAKAMEDIGDYNNASRYLNEGNTLQRSKFNNFSIQEVERQFSLLSEVFSLNFVNKTSDVSTKYLSVVPIFVLGLPRSGTTLVEQILSNHSRVYGCGEINDFTEAVNLVFPQPDTKEMLKDVANADNKRFQLIANYYFQKITQKTNKNYLTDKMPLNFKLIGFIRKCIPHAKIIHCFRNANDNLLSIYKNFFNQDLMPWAYDKLELKRYYEAYKKIMDHYKLVAGENIYDLCYEELTSSPKKNIENLLNFCNLAWEESCMDIENNNKPIFTASVIQARNKINTRSVNAWKNFSPFLTDLFI